MYAEAIRADRRREIEARRGAGEYWTRKADRVIEDLGRRGENPEEVLSDPDSFGRCYPDETSRVQETTRVMALHIIEFGR